MRLPIRLLSVTVAASLLAACTGAGSTPAPATPTPAPPTPVIATPTPPPTGMGYWLRMTITQALPPPSVFSFTPTAVITADGRYLVPGAVPAIFPGPLVAPIFARQVTDAGRDQVIGWADSMGLLSGKTDFTGDALMPGGQAGRIELTVEGRMITLTGIPDLSGDDPKPGTAGAFAEFWRRVAALPEALPGEVGPEQPYTPTAYAILVGPAPTPEGGMTSPIADWPLDVAVGSFGGPVMDGSYRCGIVEGADADLLRPALERANQLTQWVQDPAMSATFGLTVRPIVAGENPCAEAFGL